MPAHEARVLTPMNAMTMQRGNKGGFTLIELLTVLSIMGVLAALTVPVVQSLQKAGGFTQSVYTMADSLNFARAYAMANNTYVYVGLTELDRTQSATSSPQAVGNGRVALSIVATKDGTSDTSSWSTTGSNLIQVRQVQVFDSFHIASTGSFLTGTGTMAQPMSGGNTITPTIVASSTPPTTPFSLPLGSTSGGGKYNFSNANTAIICFTPQGGVLLNGNAYQLLEIDAQPMVGTAVPPVPTNVNQGNQAALVIDGSTGAVTVCRP